jgi:predicted DNA-binding transcriptional regulator AlpA
MRDYYTASEARAQLGLSKAEFYRRADQGRIPKFTPPGKKQSVYPKRDIDALARSMNVIFEQHDKIIFSKSTIADQEEEMKIGIRNFGQEFITPWSERIAFQQKSEFTFWSLRVEGHVVGYISTFRFQPHFLDDILTGRRIERDITVDDMLPFVRLEPFDVYIDVLAMDPAIETRLRHWYAGVLVSRFTDTILNLLGNGYFIRTIYTVTATPEGDNLVRKAGFKPMEGKSIVPGRTAYEYPMDEKGIAHLREFSRREVYHIHSRTENKTDTHQ